MNPRKRQDMETQPDNNTSFQVLSSIDSDLKSRDYLDGPANATKQFPDHSTPHVARSPDISSITRHIANKSKAKESGKITLTQVMFAEFWPEDFMANGTLRKHREPSGDAYPHPDLLSAKQLNKRESQGTALLLSLTGKRTWVAAFCLLEEEWSTTFRLQAASKDVTLILGCISDTIGVTNQSEDLFAVDIGVVPPSQVEDMENRRTSVGPRSHPRWQHQRSSSSSRCR